MKKIGENVYVETNFLGCNPGFVITEEGIVMIDAPQRPLEAFSWRNKIRELGPIVYLINTDHHYDHCLGNFYFDAGVIMHQGTAGVVLAEGRIEKCKQWIQMLDPGARHLIDNFTVSRPKFTYETKMTMCIGNEVLELIHVTSHTKDETLVYLPKQGILFTGDTVSTMGIPSTYESYPREWLGALDYIEHLDFVTLVPGHGEVGDRGSLKEFQDQFGGLVNEIEKRISNGFERDEVTEEIGYEDHVHEDYPPVFHQTVFNGRMKFNIGRIYDELKKCTV
jgi:glyoxylase-like metal-dependent hydrolase (beta-lactamase superfamily II)